VRQNIRKFSRISEKSAASAKDLKNPLRRIKLVNDLLQTGYSPALPNSSVNALSFDLNNYIRKVIDDLRRRCSELIPTSDRGLFRLMNAVRHIERRPAGDSKSGRPSHFPREKLLEVSRHLKAALAKNYRDRISLSTFISFCLPILNYPPDVLDALENGEVTRLEAAQLARLVPERLDVKPKKALAIRQEVLSNHLKMQGSQTQLRRRVAEMVGDETIMTSENMAAAVSQVDDLLTVDEDDRRHLFYEQMKEFFYAMRDIRPEEIDDSTLEEILEASDQLMGVIYKIRLKRKQQSDKEKVDKRFLL
jgi:signal transduction histidine kinase